MTTALAIFLSVCGLAAASALGFIIVRVLRIEQAARRARERADLPKWLGNGEPTWPSSTL